MLANPDDKGPLQKTHWWCSTSSNWDRWLDHRRWISEQSSTRSRGTRSRHSMDSFLFVQTKNFSGDGQEFTKVSRAVWKKPKVIYMDNSLEFGKSCEDLSWNHRTSTPYRSETNGIAERAARRVKEGTSAVLLQSGLDQTNGGLIPWNALAICEMSKTSWQMGKLLTQGDSENHAKAQWFLLVQWLNIIRFLPETSQRSTNVVRKCYQEYASDTLCTRGWIWKGDILVADIEELEKMDALEIHPRRINAKEVLTAQRGDEFIFPNSRWYSKIVRTRSRIPRTH